MEASNLRFISYKTCKLLLSKILIILFISCSPKNSDSEFKEEFYRKLEYQLELTKKQLVDYLGSIENSAHSICNDEMMVSFFRAKKEYYALAKDTALPLAIVESIEQLKIQIQSYYLSKYLNFYDILFIDKNGDIFYTIRKQADYHKNIFKGELVETALSKKLLSKPHESYVDFQFYEISGEPSAFFIEPVLDGNNLEGWFVMQCAINKIDRLFEENEHLGKTGEVVLVNKDNYLLTNSRFKVNPTILQQKLPERNITKKFAERKGRKLVIDYRGKEVYSVFEVLPFFNTEWLIIVKADKDEYTSKYYKAFKEQIYPKLLSNLEKEQVAQEEYVIDSNIVNVDMDEWQRTDNGQVLFTQGVSTCTAIIITFPGKFSYMAHISPYDKIYGETRTDIFKRLLKQISYFDITESDKSKLQFYIASANHNSFSHCIDMILDNGYFLSQIKVLYGKKYKYGNVFHDASVNQTVVNWRLPDNNYEFVGNDFEQQESIDKLLE